MEDNEKKPEVYEREKLYDEVWVEPVKIVARRYGVSDVALAKTCRKLAILLPALKEPLGVVACLGGAWGRAVRP